MKRIHFYAYVLMSVLALAPVVALAQDDGTSSSTFVNSLPLWIAVVIGLVTSFMVLHNAKKIGGGTLAQVYNHFGIGMLLVVIGFIAVVVPPWASMQVIMRTHDLLFVIGFIVMALGAGKILKAAGIK